MNGQIMNKYSTAILMALAFGLSALAPSAVAYTNGGTVTNGPQIDSPVFYNSGDFVSVPDGAGELTEISPDKTQYVYETHDTLYYTNAYPGLMLGQPGFLFEDVLSTGGTNEASSFYNTGTILGVDAVTYPEFYQVGGGAFFFYDGTGVALPSQIFIDASNVFNGPNGSISVGNDGLLQMQGQYVTNYDSILVAGDPTGNDTNDVTAIDQYGDVAYEDGTLLGEYFGAPPTFFDLFWGGTNETATIGQVVFSSLAAGNFPAVPITERAAGGGVSAAPGNFAGPGYAVYMTNYLINPSNEYFNIVYVYTNPPILAGQKGVPANVETEVYFTPHNTPPADGGYSEYFVSPLTATQNPEIIDPNGLEDIVQFSEPFTNVITGQTQSSAIYFLDGGAIFSNVYSLLTNTIEPASGYARPSYYEVTQRTPSELREAFLAATNNPLVVLTNLSAQAQFANSNAYAFSNANGPYVYYPPSTTAPPEAPYTAVSYDVQVGWDPELVSGVFPASGGADEDIPDPTQEPARIDIEGAQVDLTQARIRAEGLVTIGATNLVGAGPSAVDWGTANATLGESSGSVVISNLFPKTFTRLRGDLAAWSLNYYTSASNIMNSNFTAVSVHVLVLEPYLQGSFTPNIRNLTLTGRSSIDLENTNPITVINQVLFDTPTLTINSTINLTQNANNFSVTNVTGLNYLLINTNGALNVNNALNLGVNTSSSLTSAATAQYSIASIENLGKISAQASDFQSIFFENDGTNMTTSGGSMTIEAQTLDMGVLTTHRNSTLVDGNLTLSAVNMGFTNSFITDSSGSLTLQPTADGQITDFVPGVAGQKNLNNFWQVNNGFNLLTKPATGDLYGTQITSTVSNSVATHVWAGRNNYTNVIDGFIDNVVIGELVLSVVSNGQAQFKGAGTNNGMYIDYLDLTSPLSVYTNGGLAIDPSLTIYFAAANVNPLLLESNFPSRLVWVSNFWGPNSSILVTNKADLSQACYFNTNLAATGNTNYSFLANGDCAMLTLNPEFPAQPADFTNTTLASVKGTYNGLFIDTNQIASTNSGFITFTLNANGTFSGKLEMGSTNYTFTGTRTNAFDAPGAADATAKHGRDTLAVHLQLVDSADSTTPQVTGYVSNANWVAQIQGNLNPKWTSKNPSPYEGRYTMILTNSATNSGPDGDSYGSFTVSKLGQLVIAGKLADSYAFSQSVPVAENGHWPFYTYVAGGKDELFGWIDFSLSLVNEVTIEQTNIFWSKEPSAKAHYYPAGFSTNTFEVITSTNTVPGKDSSGLSLVDPIVILSGGGLSLTNAVLYNGNVKYSTTNLVLNINKTTGVFTGHIKLAQPGPAVQLDGVVLQDENEAFGFFLGADGSAGSVTLESSP
jgi:hypothetical protein